MSDWRPLIEALPVVTSGAAQLSDPQRVAQQLAPVEDAGLVGSPAVMPQPAVSPALVHDEQLALARAEAEALALRYRAAIDDLVQAREQVIRAAETDMVRLALTIAKETVMGDVTGRERFTTQMVEHALSLLTQSHTLTLRIGPRDLVAIKQHKPELLQRQGLQVVEDDALSAGGCIADGTQGRVDASLTARLEAMAKKLLGDPLGAT